MTQSAQPSSYIPEPASKVLIIGLDGATWSILDPLISSGCLPNIEKLIKNGARGILESTIPPVTACAWPSFYTGRHPANHGVFDFRKRMSPDSTERGWVSQTDIAGPTIWDIASAQDKTVGLINLPLTYPPVEVNGYMIGGMPVPPASDEIGYPKGLVNEIIHQTGGYISDIDLLRGESPDTGNPEKCFEFVDAVASAVETRGRAAGYLMDKHPTDLTFVVLVTPDRLTHLFYKIFSPRKSDPPLKEWEIELKSRMIDAFKRMDAVVGDLVKKTNETDLIVVMSDHGFGPLDELLKMNRVLSDLGFLKFTSEAEGGIRRKIGRLLPESIKKPIRTILGMDRDSARNGENPKRKFDPYRLIDWDNTKAYSGGSTEQGIYLNVNGREPHGVVQMGGEYHKVRDELISALRNYKHPDGTAMFDWVEPSENIHSGEFLKDAPDIVFELRGYSAVVGEDAEPPTIGPWMQPRAGYHRRDGIVILNGPMIKRGIEIARAGIIDVTPTILACWGLSYDKSMDGEIIENAVIDEFKRKFPPQKGEFQTSARKIDTCKRDDSEVEDLMKGLGYLN